MHRKTHSYTWKDVWMGNNKQSDHLTTQPSSYNIAQHLSITCSLFNRVILAGKLLTYSCLERQICKDYERKYRAINTTNSSITNYNRIVAEKSDEGLAAWILGRQTWVAWFSVQFNNNRNHVFSVHDVWGTSKVGNECDQDCDFKCWQTPLITFP